VAEVEVTCLEYSHDLKTYGWLTMEGDGNLRHHALHQSNQRLGSDTQCALLDEGFEVLYGAMYLE
jgi:hypothetical protein